MPRVLASLLVVSFTALPVFAHGEYLLVTWFGVAWVLPAWVFFSFPWSHPRGRWLSLILLSLGCAAFILVPRVSRLVDLRGGEVIALFGPAVVAFAISEIACRLAPRAPG